MDEKEPTPLFGSWRNFYFAVVIWLIAQILLYYLFTRLYA